MGCWLHSAICSAAVPRSGQTANLMSLLFLWRVVLPCIMCSPLSVSPITACEKYSSGPRIKRWCSRPILPPYWGATSLFIKRVPVVPIDFYRLIRCMCSQLLVSPINDTAVRHVKNTVSPRPHFVLVLFGHQININKRV